MNGGRFTISVLVLRPFDKLRANGLIQRFLNKKTKNHINGIEGFWSYAKHILYNYRGISRYHFPMYLKEIEFRYNHRQENFFKLFLNIYFGYVSP